MRMIILDFAVLEIFPKVSSFFQNLNLKDIYTQTKTSIPCNSACGLALLNFAGLIYDKDDLLATLGADHKS